MLRRHLRLAETHVALGRKNLEWQRRIVAQLERDNQWGRTYPKGRELHWGICAMRPMSEFDPTVRRTTGPQRSPRQAKME